MTSEEASQDQPHRVVARVGDTVRRPAQPWAPTVPALLRHLEAVGFPYAPRALGSDDQGREVLTFINGESGPQSWAKVVDDQGLPAFAPLLRDYHDATTGFTPPDDATWADGAIAPSEGQVICHGGLTTTAGVVDAVIDRQLETIDLARRLASQGHEPQATWVREGLLEKLGRRLVWSSSNPHRRRRGSAQQPTECHRNLLGPRGEVSRLRHRVRPGEPGRCPPQCLGPDRQGGRSWCGPRLGSG
ncbi:hypothetical protein DSC45_13470 [Streptomyces sp. YIM 130001]|nr:hypothetical protein DSC45_13470 [Streptomyces sp. YIM 130001]